MTTEDDFKEWQENPVTLTVWALFEERLKELSTNYTPYSNLDLDNPFSTHANTALAAGMLDEITMVVELEFPTIEDFENDRGIRAEGTD